jgi:P2 family phage contractile tail tube protein
VIDRSTYGGFGLINGLRTTAIVRAAVVDPVTGLPKPVIHTMVGDLTVVEPSSYKPGERATLKTSMALIYYKLSHTVPGVPLVEVDIVNGVRIINGIDQLLALRLIVGR